MMDNFDCLGHGLTLNEIELVDTKLMSEETGIAEEYIRVQLGLMSTDSETTISEQFMSDELGKMKIPNTLSQKTEAEEQAISPEKVMAESNLDKIHTLWLMSMGTRYEELTFSKMMSLVKNDKKEVLQIWQETEKYSVFEELALEALASLYMNGKCNPGSQTG